MNIKDYRQMLADGMTYEEAMIEKAKLITSITEHRKQLIYTQSQLDAMESVSSYIDQCENGMAICHNDIQRSHNLLEACLDNRLIGDFEEVTEVGINRFELLIIPAHKFLVSTDFAALIDDDTFNDSDFRLPYEHCLFEFVINDRPIINICFDIDGVKNCIAYVKANNFWLLVGTEGKDINFANEVWIQIKAACIAMEAGVTDQTIIEPSLKVNQKREKTGKSKISSYSVVNLAKRYYQRSAHSLSEASYRQRLHFRRGHWRHYENEKVWIKWCLAGDPALGFVNKHYKA